MLKLKLQYFGHLMRRVDSLEKTLRMKALIITLLLQRGGQCPEQEGCRVSGSNCEHSWESEHSSERGCEHSSRDEWGCEHTAGEGVNTQLGEVGTHSWGEV